LWRRNAAACPDRLYFELRLRKSKYLQWRSDQSGRQDLAGHMTGAAIALIFVEQWRGMRFNQGAFMQRMT